MQIRIMPNLQKPNTMKKSKRSAPKTVEPIIATPAAAAAVAPAEKVNVITPSAVSSLKEKLQEKKTEKADVTNADAALQKIQYERDLKWLYPANCTTTGARKVFRQKSRNQIRRWESQALKLEGKLKEAKMAEILAYRVIVLADPNAAV